MNLALRLFPLWIVAVMAACSCFGQTNIVSPEVSADGNVTFRLLAPKAAAVTLQGLRGQINVAMTKDARGVWSATIGPLKPDLYSYHFDVDGARVIDPLNRVVKKWVTMESLVEVTGQPAALSALQPVPHGVVHRHYLASKERGVDTPLQVYTPPGYDPKDGKRYPVVYLLHGYGDDETAWTEVGRAQFIADNLIAQGRMTPALIVMTHGHPVPIAGGFADYAPRNLAALERELLGEVIPFVEVRYAASSAAGDRAIVGQSMGGGQSLGIGLAHPEAFQWVGGFSSVAPSGKLDATFPKLAAAPPRLLWFACGSGDSLKSGNESFDAWLQAHKVPHTWRLTDGGHDWWLWRDYLAEFLGLIFR